MISPKDIKRWKNISEKYRFKTLSQFVYTAVEFFISSL